MDRLKQLFDRKKKDVLNIYFTAGYPNLNDTGSIILALEKAGVDLVEIGMPYSDPLADGPTIQASGKRALENGMTLDLLFKQVEAIRGQSNIPLILMGYVNQMMQYGVEEFLGRCREVGIDGLILPDLPLEIYESEYQKLFQKHHLGISFLMTPHTPDARIQKIDALTSAFVYVVSNAAITGAKKGISEAQLQYFKQVENRTFQNPTLIGFGISDFQSFTTACKFANGAIIGSAFIRAISDGEHLEEKIENFVKGIKTEKVNV